mmetsp:Transcript_13933/g.34030  ORF Transcript_13933/g.34030 Transcript_13933/m.34030 type:complete len:93 (+) Transcript_13933:28-306(+)
MVVDENGDANGLGWFRSTSKQQTQGRIFGGQWREVDKNVIQRIFFGRRDMLGTIHSDVSSISRCTRGQLNGKSGFAHNAPHSFNGNAHLACL